MNPYLLLAKQAIESYIKARKIIAPPEDLSKEFFERKAGVFVTINTKYKIQNTKYELRGCIGTYLPTRINIAEEIIRNAIAAATEDYRFGPVQEKELSSLSYTVYILDKPELVKDIKELNPQKYGIIVKTEIKSGLLLPDLDGVDTIEKKITICCQKGGIDPTKEKIFFYRLTTEKYQ